METKEAHGAAEGSETSDSGCVVCLNAFEHPLKTNCGHIFCEGCIGRLVSSGAACPSCRAQIATLDANNIDINAEKSKVLRVKFGRHAFALCRHVDQPIAERLAHVFGLPVERIKLLHRSKIVSESEAAAALVADPRAVFVVIASASAPPDGCAADSEPGAFSWRGLSPLSLLSGALGVVQLFVTTLACPYESEETREARALRERLESQRAQRFGTRNGFGGGAGPQQRPPGAGGGARRGGVGGSGPDRMSGVGMMGG